MREPIDGVDFAVDEHIWGHRLYDEQLPHLAVMEFLGVLGSNRESPLIEAPGEKVRYKPQRQIRLRSLLFNNPYIQTVRDRPISDSDKWDQWQELFLAARPAATSDGVRSLYSHSGRTPCTRTCGLTLQGPLTTGASLLGQGRSSI